ncbi:PQQ-binding-like beta-propeller repeat protein [Pedobacter sp. HMF7647]|uniref:PQQ-binding-like beta-propeller repeat protein n=1 Tax=Hufsiella arboris TaxID=2695275 RepID=A0A7K1YC24_9SPHI|nr:PQQ-binding-like beta-propeller repeat protein [Hufsiella arboris]MXV52133.1 PQQ-binding-like beta-propeller repeat protein [Hufsiella arboris]
MIKFSIRSEKLFRFSLPIYALSCLFACHSSTEKHDSWQVYNGSKTNIKYSTLDEIDTSNVSKLKVAWQFDTGDADTVNHSQIQCNPIVIDSILYGTSPQMKLFALNASTGKIKWMFNPFDSLSSDKKMFFILNNCRGVTYWTDGKQDKRIFYTAGSELYAINAKTGKPVSDFGIKGKLDLHEGLGRDVKDLFVSCTTPGVIFNNLLILGSRVDEGANAAPGHIRAFDVKTGKLAWLFHTIPHPGEQGYDSWEDKEAYKHIGGANCWSGFSLDEKRGIVYAPIGSASFDFYGGKRTGYNLFADCLVALNASTGKLVWYFQDIHHDVWDRDLPAPPVLFTINKDGKEIDALAQTTKTGFVFVLNRETGKPLYPVKETAVPTDTELDGEKLWPTQPIPSLPEPFMRQKFTEADVNKLLPEDSQREIIQQLASYKNGNMFNPPSKQGTVLFPGFDGGGEWGGAAFDPKSKLLYVNANEMPWVLKMIAIKKESPVSQSNLLAGKSLYLQNCIACHGPQREGSGNYPSLIGINKRYNLVSFKQLISTGRRMMPAFKQLNEEEKNAIASFVLDDKGLQSKSFKAQPKADDPYLDMPYTNTGYNKFLSKEGYPAISPPWGTLNAINMESGKFEWKIPLGNDARFKNNGAPTGTENYGGPVVTAGGIVFIAATSDSKLRAFNKRNGKLLATFNLPASGFATPAIFQVNGKQYVVIACGGGKLGTKSGDSYVAYSL